MMPKWVCTNDGAVFDRVTPGLYMNRAIGIKIHRHADGWRATMRCEVLEDIYGREIAYPMLLDAIEAALGTWRS